jgi:glycosyltransferase involved in cell wall biosynthesis
MKTLFICGTPPHPVHEAFAKSINADFFNLPEKFSIKKIKKLMKIPKDYDIYFSEGLFGYLYLLKLLGKIRKKSKTINLFADPRIYQIINNKKFDFKKLRIKKYPFIKKFFLKKAIRKLNGAICVGNYEKTILKKIDSKLSSEAVFAFVERPEFFKFKSKLKEDNIFFVGGGPDYDYKGVDFLIRVFREVKKESKKTKLFIIGGNWEDFEKKVKKKKDIFFLGNKNSKEIREFMDNSSICCHFGRGDTFPVSTLESMNSGIPTMVSLETGTKEVVKKVREDFVVPLENIGEISKKILEYFKLNKKEKINLGKKFQKEAKFFNEKNCINLFKERWGYLLNKIGVKNEGINDKSPHKNN